MPQRSRTRRGLATWLAGSTTPLFVLDAHRKVLFFNRGCEILTGWSAGDVIGQVCDYVSEPDPSQVESLTGSLCPPPEVLEGREASVPSFVMTRHGKKLARTTRYVPLLTEAGTIDRVLGIISPLGETAGPTAVSPDRQLHTELAAIRADLRKRYEMTTLVGQSPAFHRILRQIEMARSSQASVHLRGEPGTGREHIARLIHYQSPARSLAFTPLDCSRLTSSELAEALGRLLAAATDEESTHLRPGTLFLNNVEQLPADLQREIVDQWSRPSGAPPVRLLSASIQPLEAAVQADVLREDCLQLLTSLVIEVPPLRDRKADLALLAQEMLERHNRDRETQVAGFSEEVWAALRRYDWPGNQSELQAVIGEARAACAGKLITPADLPFRFRTGQQARRVNPGASTEVVPLEARLAEVERDYIRQVLEACGQNKTQAAERLGITRPKLYRRMSQLGLDAGADASR